MRLAKYLSTSGVASRRAAEQIIRAGRVTVGAITITDPARNVELGDAVAVDGKPIAPATETVVYAVNKPAGVVSTARDPQGRPTVTSMIPDAGTRLYPVGRLDIDTTGLILLTNDGELALRLTHPRYEVPKTYRVVVAGPVHGRTLDALRHGVELEDGLTAPARVRRVAPDTLELTIHEGRKRQVKRMCERVGHRVKRLERIRFGPLELGDLKPGGHRRLSAEEIETLRAGAGGGGGGGGAHG